MPWASQRRDHWRSLKKGLASAGSLRKGRRTTASCFFTAQKSGFKPLTEAPDSHLW